MSTEAHKLFENAMSLPAEDRADLAARLIESLDTASDEDATSAWDEEIARRLAELDSGKTRTIPWSDARQVIEDRPGHGADR